MVDDGRYTYEYDYEGNLFQRTDNVAARILFFTWDHRNRLTKIRESNGATTIWEMNYEYDVFDRRVSRSDTRWVQVDGGEGQDNYYVGHTNGEKYIYDGDNVVLDFLFPDGGSGYQLSHRYLYGPAVDQVLAQENVAESLSDADRVYWLLGDNLGTIRDLVDNFGNQVSGGHYKYDAYGQILSGDKTLTRYLYTGREFDPKTGLQYNRHRWYDPHTGRFLSEDPIGIAGGTNPYQYGGSSPTNFTDPNGLAKLPNWLRRSTTIDKNTAELVLQSGSRIKIRNSKFIDSTVGLNDLANLTEVSPGRLKRVRAKFGNVTVRFDKLGQPDFSPYMAASVRIGNPGASNYAQQGWRQLELQDGTLFRKLWPQRGSLNWHHAPDGSLQLVDADLHAAFQHTGLNSVLRKLTVLGIVGVGMIAGGEELMAGDFNGAARAATVDVALPWSSVISGYFSWLYDWASDESNSGRPGTIRF